MENSIKKTGITELDSSLEKVKLQVEDFLNQTIEARNLSERDRDYYDGYQWSDDEIARLRGRNQAPIVVNRVKPKVEGLKGLLSIRKTDIKAFPRNYKNDEQAAHAVTDALRFVYDDNDFDNTKSNVFENKTIEGYGAANVEVEVDGSGEPAIRINPISWDRFYFDPCSRKKDFKDARYMGEMIWMDKDQLIELFPEKEAEINSLAPQSGDQFETFDDKPAWHMGSKDRKRFRIVKHYFIKKGEWQVAIFTDGLFFVEPQASPYLDEFGKPTCPIEADSAYIDRENRRYGEVRAFIDQQDEINHRRSKALHLLSSRQTIAREGSIKDVDELKRQLAKPNGHVQVQGEITDFQVLPTGDMAQAQFEFYQDSKAELDATSFNAQLSGERQSGDLSGKAIDRLQSAGAMEIDSLYKGTSNWQKRVFVQVWARIKQFWTAEKWVRVTDDQNNLRWVGLNTQVTLKQLLEETIKDESKPLPMRAGASAAYAAMLQTNNPRLQEIVSVKNNVAELETDLILEESFDVVNIQAEQFDIIAGMWAKAPQEIDVTDVIELSQLRNKKEVIDKIKERRAAMAQSQQQAALAAQQTEQVKNAKTFADTQKSTQEAQQKAIENQLLLSQPQQITSVAV